jgi:hypothetical protein
MSAISYKQIRKIKSSDFSLDLLRTNEPVVIEGLVSNWPLVKKSINGSLEDIRSYLLCYYESNRILAFASSHEDGKKFTYADTVSRKSFTEMETTLDLIMDTIIESKNATNPGTVYMGSTSIDYVLPGLSIDNNFHIGDHEILKSIWIGNKSIVPAHFDVPDNIAFVCSGQRKFTLFPPSQLANLYVGPLEFTPAGQPISMVDIYNPDLKAFPKFNDAMGFGQSADLLPGDAIFIPSLWWHQVESFGELNVLINYWWRSVPSFMGNPMDALMHSILSIRDLPDHQKINWVNMFNYYVFNYNNKNFSHVPEDISGALGQIDHDSSKKIRALLLSNLNR